MGMGALGSNCRLTKPSRKGIKGQSSQEQKGHRRIKVTEPQKSTSGTYGKGLTRQGTLGQGRGADLLTDFQGTLAQGLSLPEPPTLPVEDSQVIEGGGHLQGWGRQIRGEKAQPTALPPGPQLTAGCSGPSVCSRICRASWRRSVASLYLFWSLWGGPGMEGSQPSWGSRARDLAEPSMGGTFAGPFWVSTYLKSLA